MPSIRVKSEKGRFMCLAVPMEVLEIEENRAWVSVGGTRREIRLDIVDQMPEKGDYVLVHAGFAIHRIDEKTARETLGMLQEMLSHETSG